MTQASNFPSLGYGDPGQVAEAELCNGFTWIFLLSYFIPHLLHMNHKEPRLHLPHLEQKTELLCYKQQGHREYGPIAGGTCAIIINKQQSSRNN